VSSNAGASPQSLGGLANKHGEAKLPVLIRIFRIAGLPKEMNPKEFAFRVFLFIPPAAVRAKDWA